MEIKIQELNKEIQKTIIETHDDLENTIYYGKSADNKVKVSVKGNYDLDEIKIDPSLLNLESKEILEKNIVEAVDLAMRSSQLDYQTRLLELMNKFYSLGK